MGVADAMISLAFEFAQREPIHARLPANLDLLPCAPVWAKAICRLYQDRPTDDLMAR